jgi:pyridoxal biosynthesis lyase PdxS
MQLVGTGVFGQPVPPEVAELIVAASNFRDKQKLFDIVEKMKGGTTA